MFCGTVWVARYAFCILHACMNHGLAYVDWRSKVNRDPMREEELASLIRLWRGSCCFASVHNECTIKDCGCVASLYTTYRIRRCINWFRASQFIFANTRKSFPRCFRLHNNYWIFASAHSLTNVLLLFPFPSIFFVAQLMIIWEFSSISCNLRCIIPSIVHTVISIAAAEYDYLYKKYIYIYIYSIY